MKKRKLYTSVVEEVTPIEIRWPNIGEEILRTGQVVTRNCIVVERCVSDSWPLIPQFYLIGDDLLSDVAEYATPVLFDECISDTLDRIAVPQVPTRSCRSSTDWDACIGAIPSVPLLTGATICYGENSGEFKLYIELPKQETHSENVHFRAQVESALAPNLIDDIDHPMVGCLQDLLGNPDDDCAPLEWNDVE